MAAVTTLAATPDVDQLVHDLRRLYYGAGLEMMIRVGSLIVERLFEGDPTRWQSHGRKDISFRKLAKHPDLPFQASTLSRAVGMYLLAKRSPGISKLERVGPSHLQEVLSLEHDEQDRLLKMANTQGWSTRRLREEIRSSPRLVERRTVLNGVPSFQKCLDQWRQRIEDRALQTDLENIDHLDIDAARNLLALVRSLCQQSEALARRLSTRLSVAERRGYARAIAAPATRERPSGAAPQHSALTTEALAQEMREPYELPRAIRGPTRSPEVQA